MLPRELLQYHLAGDVVIPHFVGHDDLPWVAELVEALGHFLGGPAAAWQARRDEGFEVDAPEGQRRMVLAVLERCVRRKVRPLEVPPRRVREVVFAEADRHRGQPRAEILERAASRLGVDVDEVERALLADLATERLITAAQPLPTPPELIASTNVALIQGLLRRSVEVEIHLRGHAHAVVRQVLLRRLIAVARRRQDGVRLEISGTYSLFRRTTLYGRALASVVPVLGWCDHYQMRATLALGGREGRLALSSDDRIGVGAPPRRYDSKLEARFVRDMARQAPQWAITREPEPIDVGDTLVFPDFALRHRGTGAAWLVEIVGFWTPDYLARKLSRLAASGRTDLVLCVDRALCTAAEPLPTELKVVLFSKKVDVGALLALLDAPVLCPGPRTVELGLTDLFLDYAGRKPPADGIHQRLAELTVDDTLVLHRDGGRWLLVASAGPVAALSRRGATRLGASLVEGGNVTVRGKVRRHAASSAAAYRGHLRCASWEVPLVSARVPDG